MKFPSARFGTPASSIDCKRAKSSSKKMRIFIFVRCMPKQLRLLYPNTRCAFVVRSTLKLVAFRHESKARGIKPNIPNKSNRKKRFRFSKLRYRKRHFIENAFCRLKDFRRIATRYD